MLSDRSKKEFTDLPKFVVDPSNDHRRLSGVPRAITADPPHVWHQEVVVAGYAPGFDGIVNDYFLVRASHFQPRGELTDDQLAAEEHLAAFRWWQLSEIAGYPGPKLFSPRDLTTPLTALLAAGPPDQPVQFGR